MKRETRPFIVEVRRGSKKQSAPFLPPPPEGAQGEKSPLQRAEEILFSREPSSSEKTTPPRTGRILEPVTQPSKPPEPEPEPVEQPARRRGRPPGSKNRPTESKETAERPGRGRPRLAPEVRRLKLTPELVNAAMQTITELGPKQGRAAQRLLEPGAGFEEAGPPVKRPRGRPRSRPTILQLEEAPELPLGLEDEFAFPPAPPRPRLKPPAPARRFEQVFERGLRRSDLRRLFKPGERWKGRMRLRALARRRKSS